MKTVPRHHGNVKSVSYRLAMVQTTARPAAKLVQVCCDPPILDEVVRLALSQLPRIVLVPPDSPSADIVVTSISDSDDGSPPAAGREGIGLILFDPATNLMGVRKPGQGLEVLPGDLDGVLEVIRSWTL